MFFIKKNKVKILKLIVGILAIPYIYIIVNSIFYVGRIIGSVVRIKMG